jgi:hypothetical protein
MGSGTSSLNQRKELVGRQLEAHQDMCNRIQHNGGGNCPGNFYDAWSKTNNMGLFTPNTATNYRELNTKANHAKHRW